VLIAFGSVLPISFEDVITAVARAGPRSHRALVVRDIGLQVDRSTRCLVGEKDPVGLPREKLGLLHERVEAARPPPNEPVTLPIGYEMLLRVGAPAVAAAIDSQEKTSAAPQHDWFVNETVGSLSRRAAVAPRAELLIRGARTAGTGGTIMPE
jgi:hypothetical protein